MWKKSRNFAPAIPRRRDMSLKQGVALQTKISNMGTKQVIVNDKPISVFINPNSSDYISLTDMVKAYDGGVKLIEKWLSTKSTVDFLGTWEILNNPNFKTPEFGGIRMEAGSNRFYLSVNQFVEKTNAIGLFSKAGRYGGTYAHRDIAYNFGMWLSPEFFLLVIKEIERLKAKESDPLLIEWDVKRILSKTNYTIHTDAIRDNILPVLSVEKTKEYLVYASEADMLNLALFGCTAKDWEEANPQLSKNMNIRDTATINQLVVLSNMESYNSELIKQGAGRQVRYNILRQMAQDQLESLKRSHIDQEFRKITGNTPGILDS